MQFLLLCNAGFLRRTLRRYSLDPIVGDLTTGSNAFLQLTTSWIRRDEVAVRLTLTVNDHSFTALVKPSSYPRIFLCAQ